MDIFWKYTLWARVKPLVTDIIFKISIKEEIAIPIPVVNKAFSDNTGLKY